jgi:methyl-accepting chemotaxis protein/methyl-accepting chemotaxis protein-1 (serine sensor receptor)
MTLGTKLLIGVVSILGLSILASVLGLMSIAILKNSFDQAVDETARKTELAGIINVTETRMFADQRGVILYAFTKDQVHGERFQRAFDGDMAQLQTAIDALRPLLKTERENQLLQVVEDSSKTWLSLYQQLRLKTDAGDPETALAISREKIIPLHEKLDKASSELVQQQRAFLAADRNAVAESYTLQHWLVLLTLALSLLVAAVVVIVVRSATGNLKGMATSLSDSAGQVSAAAGQVASSSQSLAQDASEQAASLEQTSASTEEITSMTRKNAENSGTVARLMVDAGGRVDVANRALDQMVMTMKEIDASSDKVSKIIKVIDEIAFQTNMLAFTN